MPMACQAPCDCSHLAKNLQHTAIAIHMHRQQLAKNYEFSAMESQQSVLRVLARVSDLERETDLGCRGCFDDPYYYDARISANGQFADAFVCEDESLWDLGIRAILCTWSQRD